MVRAKLASSNILSSLSWPALLIRKHNVCHSLSFCSRYFSSEINDSDTVKMTDSSTTAPRNLFEVFASNENLLTGKKRDLDVLSREDLELELKRQGRRQRNRRVKIDPSKVAWTSGSKRVGAIGIKLGMSALWLKDGRRVPVTLVQVRIDLLLCYTLKIVQIYPRP